MCRSRQPPGRTPSVTEKTEHAGRAGTPTSSADGLPSAEYATSGQSGLWSLDPRDPKATFPRLAPEIRLREACPDL